MATGERISQQTPVLDPNEINVQTWLVGDFEVTVPGSGITKRLSKDQLAQAMLNVGPIGDAIRAINATVEKLAGYISPDIPTDPAIQVGVYWLESSAQGKPSTVFPWTGLRKFTAAGWQESGDAYTPNSFDMWANRNDSTGYYWFDGDWNVRDVNVDGITIRYNPNTQLIEVAPLGVDISRLAQALQDSINGALQTTGGVMTGTITLPAKDNYNTALLAAAIADIENLNLGQLGYVGAVDPVTTYGNLAQYTKWLDTNNNQIGTMGADGTTWTFAPVRLINGIRAFGVYSGNANNEQKEAVWSRTTMSWTLIQQGSVTTNEFDDLAEDAVRKSVINATLLQNLLITDTGILRKVTETVQNGALVNYDFTQGEINLLKACYDIGNAHRYNPPIAPESIIDLALGDQLASVHLPDDPANGFAVNAQESFTFQDNSMVRNRWFAALDAQGIGGLAGGDFIDYVQFGTLEALTGNQSASVALTNGKTLAWNFRKYTNAGGLVIGDKLAQIVFGAAPVFAPTTSDVDNVIAFGADELHFVFDVGTNVYSLKAGVTGSLNTIWDSSTAEWAADWSTDEWAWTQATKTLVHTTAGNAVTAPETYSYPEVVWGNPVVTLQVNPSAHVAFDGHELYDGDAAWLADTSGDGWAWTQANKRLDFSPSTQIDTITLGGFTAAQDGSEWVAASRRIIDYNDGNQNITPVYSTTAGWAADWTAANGTAWSLADKTLTTGPGSKIISAYALGGFTLPQWCNGTWTPAEQENIDVEQVYLSTRYNSQIVTQLQLKVAQLSGMGGPLPAADLGPSSDITQEGILEHYCEAIWGSGGVFTWNADNPAQSTYIVGSTIHYAVQIFPATWIRNTNDNHRWVLVNTPDTNPPVFEFTDVGVDTVDVANESTPGIVKATTEFAVAADGTPALMANITTPVEDTNQTTGGLAGITSYLQKLVNNVAALFANKANLEDGKVPEEELPLTYDGEGSQFLANDGLYKGPILTYTAGEEYKAGCFVKNDLIIMAVIEDFTATTWSADQGHLKSVGGGFQMVQPETFYGAGSIIAYVTADGLFNTYYVSTDFTTPAGINDAWWFALVNQDAAPVKANAGWGVVDDPDWPNAQTANLFGSDTPASGTIITAPDDGYIFMSAGGTSTSASLPTIQLNVGSSRDDSRQVFSRNFLPSGTFGDDSEVFPCKKGDQFYLFIGNVTVSWCRARFIPLKRTFLQANTSDVSRVVVDSVPDYANESSTNLVTEAATSVSQRRWIADEPCYLHWAVRAVTGVNMSYIIFINGSYAASFDYNYGGNNNINGKMEGIIKVNTGDLVQVGGSANPTGTYLYKIPIKYILAGQTIPVYPLKDSPHLWPIGQEIDFHDGSFGYRVTDVATPATSGSNVATATLVPGSGMLLLEDYGGSWFPYYPTYGLGYPIGWGDQSGTQKSWLTVSNNIGIVLNTMSNGAGKVPSFWAIYRKP